MSEEKKFSKTFVRITLLCGCEHWTLLKQDVSRLEAGRMWFWRKMTKASWAEEKRTEDVLMEIDTTRNLMVTLNKRRTSLFGHILRQNDFIKNILRGKPIGKKMKGTIKNETLGQIVKPLRYQGYHEGDHEENDGKQGRMVAAIKDSL